MRFPSTLRPLYAAVLALGTLAMLARPASADLIDPNLPAYKPSHDVSGRVALMGSTTMTNVAGIWMDTFKQYHPEVQDTLEIRGSRGAVDAVLSGDATFGLLSRSISKEEVDRFRAKFGYDPKVLTCCLEPIAIYVHKDNPIRSLTVEQVRDIFTGKAKTWGDVGVTGQWAPQPILTHGRGEQTGSRVFLEQGLLRGAQHTVRTEHESNRDLVTGVGSDYRGIGYAGLIYKLPGVKAVAISAGPEQQPVAVDSLAAARGGYPIALVRPLQLVVNQPATGELPKPAAEFLRYVFSRSGQEDVIKGGFQPISARPARIALDATGLSAAR